MRAAREELKTAGFVVGYALTAYGIALVSVPAAFIASGVALAALCYAAAGGEE